MWNADTTLTATNMRNMNILGPRRLKQPAAEPATKQPANGTEEEFLDDLAKSLVVEEYSTLRSEIHAAYGYAQSIVRWTIATFAAVTAAGLIALYNATTRNDDLLFAIALILFGVGIPGIVWMNSWTWLGELYRAERAGSYLRNLEARIEASPGLKRRLGFSPIRWETFIWSHRKKNTLWGKQTLTYLGTAGVFFGSAAGSAAIFAIIWFTRLHRAVDFLPAGVIYAAAALAINLIGLIICFKIRSRLFKLGEAVAPDK